MSFIQGLHGNFKDASPSFLSGFQTKVDCKSTSISVAQDLPSERLKNNLLSIFKLS